MKKLPLPPMSGRGTAEEQLAELRSYLFRLVDEMNNTLIQPDPTPTTPPNSGE